MHIQTSNQEIFNLGFGDYQCNWGMHLAGLYETKQERDDILMGFLHEGDVSGDLQLYCPSERGIDDFKQQYGCRHPSCKEHVNDENVFQFFPPKKLYYPDGSFSPIAMDIGLNHIYNESQKNRRRNVRAAAEMVWALDAISGVEHLMAYESRLNYFIFQKPWVSVCLYNVNKFSGSQIMNVLRTHPFTISGGIITENPYYQDPNQWLLQNAPQFLPVNINQ